MIDIEQNQTADDDIKQTTVRVMEWAMRPETLTKLLGAMGGILIASMFYSIWFIGPFISASAVTLGLVSLSKFSDNQFTTFPSLSSSEKYAILLAGSAAFLMTFISPALTATTLILASAGFGYYYMQDIVIAPLGVLNKHLLNLMSHWENTSQNQADLKSLFLAGANPHLYIEKNELDNWKLKAKFEKFLPQSVDRFSLLNCIEKNIFKQDKQLTLLKTLKKMAHTFRTNMTVDPLQSDPAQNEGSNAKAVTDQLFNKMHTMLNALVKALAPFNAFLRTQAPNELFFEHETGLSTVWEAGQTHLASLLKKDGVKGAATAFGETLTKAGDAILHGANAAKTTHDTTPPPPTDTAVKEDHNSALPAEDSSFDRPCL